MRLIALLILATVAASLAEERAYTGLRSGPFVPGPEHLPTSGLTSFYGTFAVPDQQHVYLVKVNKRMTAQLFDTTVLKDMPDASRGASLPNGVWMVRATHNQAQQLSSNADVTFVSHLRPNMKLAPELVLLDHEGKTAPHAIAPTLDHFKVLAKYVKHVSQAGALRPTRPVATHRDFIAILDHTYDTITAKHNTEECTRRAVLVRDAIVSALSRDGVSVDIDGTALHEGATVRVELAGHSKLVVSFPVHSLTLSKEEHESLDTVRETVLGVVSAHPETVWIEPRPIFKTLNKAASGLTQSFALDNSKSSNTPVWTAGLTGKGQIVGIADTGVDWDNCFFSDPSYSGQLSNTVGAITGHRKFAGLFSTVNGVDGDSKNGHGTHVTGSVSGNVQGVSALEPYNGMAYDAKVSVTAMEESFGGLNVPQNIETSLFPKSTSVGAHILSNSWGSSQQTYTSFAKEVDSFMYNNDDVLILFAAGNDGPGPSTIGSPATNKNAVAVGAQDTTNENFVNSVDYNDMASTLQEVEDALCVPNNPNPPSCCPSSCTTSYCCSSNYEPVMMACCPSYMTETYEKDTTKYNRHNMADFSSRGPTADGRIKPDVSAPGNVVISVRSDGAVTGDVCSTDYPTDGNRNAKLLSMAGTSMATPVTSGNTALIRQYYTDGYYPDGQPGGKSITPSGALLRATLVGSTVAEGSSVPNNDEGYGRTQLNAILPFKNGYELFADDGNSLADGDEKSTCVSISGGSSFRATLAYTDYPGEPMSSSPLVNTLSLTVQGPNGVKYSPGNQGASLLDVNINNPSSGDYTITVTGTFVPQSPQKYALLVYGSLSGTGCGSNVRAHNTVVGNGQAQRVVPLPFSMGEIVANVTSPSPAAPASSPAPANSPAPAKSPAAPTPTPTPAPTSNPHPVHELPPNIWAIEVPRANCARWELSGPEGNRFLQSASDATLNMTSCTFTTPAEARAAALDANATLTAGGAASLVFNEKKQAVYLMKNGSTIGVRHYILKASSAKKLRAAILAELPKATVQTYVPPPANSPAPPNTSPGSSPAPKQSPGTNPVTSPGASPSPSGSPAPKEKGTHLKLLYVILIAAGAFLVGAVIASIIVCMCKSKKRDSSAGYSSMPDVS